LNKALREEIWQVERNININRRDAKFKIRRLFGYPLMTVCLRSLKGDSRLNDAVGQASSFVIGMTEKSLSGKIIIKKLCAFVP
jgi:hypothetical protein